MIPFTGFQLEHMRHVLAGNPNSRDSACSVPVHGRGYCCQGQRPGEWFDPAFHLSDVYVVTVIFEQRELHKVIFAFYEVNKTVFPGWQNQIAYSGWLKKLHLSSPSDLELLGHLLMLHVLMHIILGVRIAHSKYETAPHDHDNEC